MSDQNPYEKLGVTKDATFDEIQDARNHLLQQYSGDPKHLEAVEAAYDSILMERLRMRQDGKIKVPEGIRYAERLSQPIPKESSAPAKKSVWLQRLLDTPSSTDILLPGSLFLSLSAFSVFYRTAGNQGLQFALIVGIGLSFYFLNRKEGKSGRSLLLTSFGLITGLIVGGLLGGLLSTQIPGITLTGEQFSTVFTFILLWVISSFLR